MSESKTTYAPALGSSAGTGEPGLIKPAMATAIRSQRKKGGSRSATKILHTAADLIERRGKERDKPDGERSMAATTQAFNALRAGTVEAELTETQGWLFMALLKISRAQNGAYQQDDYDDLVAYAALMAECAHKASLS